MSLQLDQAQSSQVASESRGSGDRPTYFNAALGAQVEIGSDFEAVLILLTSSAKQRAVAWINELLGVSTENPERDKVLAEAIDAAWGASAERLKVLQDNLSEFTEFKDSFGIPGATGVPELGLLLADMNLAIGELTEKEARTAFERRADEAVEAKRLTGEAMTPERKQQLESWVTVLSAY